MLSTKVQRARTLASKAPPIATTSTLPPLLTHAPRRRPSSSRAANDTSSSSSSQTGSPATAEQQRSRRQASAAAFLLAEAEREEAELAAQAPRKATRIPELDEKAWDGDEPQDRAIRRILQDSYKPLRVAGHKKVIPTPAPLPNYLFDEPSTLITTSSSSIPTESQSKQPWEYTFKSPNDQPSIRVGNLNPINMKRTPTVDRSTRLASALEKRWDYETGFGLGKGGARVMVPSEEEVDSAEGKEGQSGKTTGQQGRQAMGGMRAWNGIVEDKIERARQKGLFKDLKGRGKPIPKDEAESNPFISRDEYLINRIVQGQGAAPPWVELQLEAEASLSDFRSSLREAWTRRALRMLSLGGVSRTAIHQIQEGWRDPEWEARERSFHEASVKMLNGVIRRYNTLAPYPVRKAPILLNAELTACFRDCRGAIESELRRRLTNPTSATVQAVSSDAEIGIEGKVAEFENKVVDETMWSGFKRLVRQVLGKEGGVMVDHASVERR